ncbi:hypothetical protein FQN51_001449 [Onygenales sp. PD_10]|nr:hypothetical protein FQN51_001449 [Onygenales sp. PD_10]
MGLVDALSLMNKQLGEAKSLFVAICMGYFTADAAMFHYCHDKTASCSQQSLRTRSLCLVILYHFFRETVNDARDIAEDSRDGLKTLPMKLGKRNTFIIMAALGLPLDMMLTAGLWATQGGVWVNPRLVLEGGLRICLTMAAYWKILQYPRKNVWAWGAMGLLGLTPVLWAQASLLDGYRVMPHTTALISPDGKTGRLPGLGWSSWNEYEDRINETVFVRVAELLKELGLEDLGYEYVNIDDA